MPLTVATRPVATMRDGLPPAHFAGRTLMACPLPTSLPR
jgi:hypothetical protein